MTCIAALRDTQGQVWMGGDSAAYDHVTFTCRPIAHPKIFERNGMLIGYTTSFRMGQALEHMLVPPIQNVADPYRYMVTEFVPAIKELFENNWWRPDSDNEYPSGQFIVAFSGRIFEIETDLSVLEYDSDFAAVGSGTKFTLGSLHTTRHWDDPYTRLTCALEAAAEFSAGVCGPFTIMKI